MAKVTYFVSMIAKEGKAPSRVTRCNGHAYNWPLRPACRSERNRCYRNGWRRLADVS